MNARLLMVAALATLGCRGKRAPTPVASHDAGDAGAAVIDGAALDGAPVDAAVRAGVGPGYQVVDVADGRELAVTVTWAAAPAAQRRSPGRTGCGGARPPRVHVATLHGVADAIVVVDIAAGKAPPPAAPVRLRARDCLVTPSVVLAPGTGGAIEVQSADERAVTVTATGLGEAWVAAADPRPVARAHLPVLGHVIAVAADQPGAVRIALEGEADDGAIAVVPPHPYVAITDDAGVARLTGLPPGTYPVRAWLPARAGDRDRVATGEVVIGADDAAVTLVLP